MKNTKGETLDSAEFCKHIDSSEEWLMERILSYAMDQEYTMYTSTLKEAWRLSIVGLSKSLIDAIETHGQVPELHPSEKYSDDSMSQFGVLEARKHRARGIDPGMFLGLFKYYKQTYQDMIECAPFDNTYKRWCKNNSDRFFDRVEIAFVQEWIGLDKPNQLTELQLKNRDLSNEKNRYLTIFESMADPVILLDSKGKIDNYNLASSSILKTQAYPGRNYYSSSSKDKSSPEDRFYNESEIKGSNITEHFPHLSDDINHFMNSLESENSIKTTITTDKQEEKIFQMKFSKMLDVSHKFTGFVITFIDITTHNTIEKMLKTSKKELEDRVQQRTGELEKTNYELQQEVRERKLVEDALRVIVEGTSFTEGDNFFRSLARNMANALNTSIVVVAELVDIKQKLCRILSIWKNDHYEENFEFHFNGMPCEQLYETSEITSHSTNLSSLYPYNQYLDVGNAQGYLSYPLFDSSNQVIIGHLSLIDTKPIQRDKHFDSIMKILAMRAGSELERIKADREKENLHMRLAHAEKLSLIGTFLSGIAHELNNPLGIVLGFSQRMRKIHNFDNEVSTDLEIIENEAHRASEIVKNLLEVSRKQKPAKSVLDVNSIVLSALGVHDHQIKNEKIKLEISLSQGALMTNGNANQLRQVLTNVITNATQAIAVSKIHNGILRCVTAIQEDDIKISIYNNGPSIPDDLISKVFDPFFTSSDSGDGLGLGMYVSQGIIEDHGGRIFVNNVQNIGVEFHITLPVSKSNRAEVGFQPDAHDINRDLKALVVDDEPNLLTWLERTMADVDINVDKATNGLEAIALLENHDFDIIFSDIKMPKMNGIEFMKWLFSNKPNYLKRLVITTGVIDDTIRDYSKLYGCEYLMKPFTEEKVFEVLKRATKTIK